MKKSVDCAGLRLNGCTSFFAGLQTTTRKTSAFRTPTFCKIRNEGTKKKRARTAFHSVLLVIIPAQIGDVGVQ